MSLKNVLVRLVLVALVVVGFGTNVASAGWVDPFDGSSLDAAWTQTFPATEDGYYLSTGRDTAAGLTVAGSQLSVSSITGGANANHLMMLERSIGEAGTSDFTATLDFQFPYSATDQSTIQLKIMNTSGNIIAAVGMPDIYVDAVNGCRFHHLFSPATTPKDLNNDDGILDSYIFPFRPYVGRFSIERTGNVFSAHLWAGLSYETMTIQYNFSNVGEYQSGPLGTSTDAVGSLQIGFGMSGSQTTPLAVDSVGFDAVPEPSSIVSALLAGLGLAAYAWRRRKQLVFRVRRTC
jgi:hypothetical protein